MFVDRGRAVRAVFCVERQQYREYSSKSWVQRQPMPREMRRGLRIGPDLQGFRGRGGVLLSLGINR